MLVALVLAVVVISRLGNPGGGGNAEQDPALPTIPELQGRTVKPAQCDGPVFNKVCGDIHLLGGDLIEAPASRNRVVRSRIVITPEGRVQYVAKLRMEGFGLGLAARHYDDFFEKFYGWRLDPGSPPAGTLVAPRTEITRHYIGISTEPAPGQVGVVSKGFEATIHLKEVPPTGGGASDVLVDALLQTIDPIRAAKASGR